MEKTVKAARACMVAGALSDDPWDAAGAPKILLRIPGLRQLEDGLFEVEGVRPREVDWVAVAKALGFEGRPMPDRLGDEISSAVLRSDMVEFLAERVVLG